MSRWFVLLVAGLLHLWSAKDSSFSGFSVPAEANMMVVSRSAIIPETALAAVIQAWVPLFPACRADNTKDTWKVKTLYWSRRKYSFVSFVLSSLILWAEYWWRVHQTFEILSVKIHTSLNLNRESGSKERQKRWKNKLNAFDILNLLQAMWMFIPHKQKVNPEE